ncbi:MAG: hypothetical protein ABS81_06360 [Pseudonocardia sp. SCN 72-86]|nr:MAG: hypothetical protein ABS81_06360 [Pseudonocardia sp. SCN 72-86]
MLRAMLWWPPVAFVIAIAMPGAGLIPIAVSGLALAVIGIGLAALSRRRRAGGSSATPLETPGTVAASVPMPQRRAA